MLATVQGIHASRDFERCAAEVIKLDPFGFVLGGLGLDESPSSRSTMLKSFAVRSPAACSYLISLTLYSLDCQQKNLGLSSASAALVRCYLACLVSLTAKFLVLVDELLEAIAHGVDLFVTTFPNDWADLGYALCFSLDPAHDAAPGRNTLNLRDRSFELDVRPAVAGCDCYTCTRHSRAYIHHLLNTHEMLAGILLILHNCRHYAQFFTVVRRHLELSTFSSFMDRFLAAYRNAD